MIKNIVFDVGNVLLKYEPDKLLAKYGLSDEEISAAMEKVFNSVAWRECDRGVGWHDEVLLPCLEGLNKRTADAVKATCFPRDFEEYSMEQSEEMVQLLKKLKEQGYKIYILSNFSFGFHTFAPKVRAFRYCDGLFASCDYLLLKPEKEIYEKFYEVFSLNPRECIFIDDTPANIDGSRATGMDGIVFSLLKDSPDELYTKIMNCLK